MMDGIGRGQVVDRHIERGPQGPTPLEVEAMAWYNYGRLLEQIESARRAFEATNLPLPSLLERVLYTAMTLPRESASAGSGGNVGVAIGTGQQ